MCGLRRTIAKSHPAPERLQAFLIGYALYLNPVGLSFLMAGIREFVGKRSIVSE